MNTALNNTAKICDHASADAGGRFTSGFGCLVAGIALALTAVTHSQVRAAEVLYRHSGGVLTDGKFGPVSRFQAALATALKACNWNGQPPVADGAFGVQTANAIKAVTNCPIAVSLPAKDPSRNGSISDSLWQLLLPGVAVPNVDARVQTLVLTYEDTDYTIAQWNFCQSKPFYNPSKASSVCYSNDPRSYLTWGPRGATAGHGGEVQAILWLVSSRDRSAVVEAFGEEAANADRLIGLSPQSVEKLLCTVWMDPSRRQRWSSAFAKLGTNETTRTAYDEYYRSTRSDGSKVSAFFSLYAQAGLGVSEVDYGFFIDRATETSGPSSEEMPALAKDLKAAVLGKDHPNARARLFLSRRLVPANQNLRRDRAGRDVAFVLDALSESGEITDEERSKWAARGMFRASDIGLSESRLVEHPRPIVLDLSGMPAVNSMQLTAAEKFGCPAAVLNPVSPER